MDKVVVAAWRIRGNLNDLRGDKSREGACCGADDRSKSKSPGLVVGANVQSHRFSLGNHWTVERFHWRHLRQARLVKMGEQHFAMRSNEHTKSNADAFFKTKQTWIVVESEELTRNIQMTHFLHWLLLPSREGRIRMKANDWSKLRSAQLRKYQINVWKSYLKTISRKICTF